MQQKEAVDAMVKDILLMTNYASLDEIIKASENDEAGFSDDEAWAETKQFGTGQWKIVEIPGVVESTDGMPAKILCRLNNVYICSRYPKSDRTVRNLTALSFHSILCIHRITAHKEEIK